ncbi:8499_t:CDS:2, partial [Paraglomus brasilianum]
SDQMDDSIDTSVLNEGMIFYYNDESDDDDSCLTQFRFFPPVATRMNTKETDGDAKKEQTANDTPMQQRKIYDYEALDKQTWGGWRRENIVCDQEIIVNSNTELSEDDEGYKKPDKNRSCEETELISEELLSEDVGIDNYSPSHTSHTSSSFCDNPFLIVFTSHNHRIQTRHHTRHHRSTSPRDPERDIPAMSEEIRRGDV